jgi:hypothetical protein
LGKGQAVVVADADFLAETGGPDALAAELSTLAS